MLVPCRAEAMSLITSALQGMSAALVSGWVTRCGVRMLTASALQGHVFSASWHLH